MISPPQSIQNHCLRRTRDLLLPRLMPGQMELAATSDSNVMEILEV